jgi:hypothetical protein
MCPTPCALARHLAHCGGKLRSPTRSELTSESNCGDRSNQTHTGFHAKERVARLGFADAGEARRASGATSLPAAWYQRSLQEGPRSALTEVCGTQTREGSRAKPYSHRVAGANAKQGKLELVGYPRGVQQSAHETSACEIGKKAK